MPVEARKSEQTLKKNLGIPKLVLGNWSKILYWGLTLLGAHYLYSIGVGLEILAGLVGVQVLQWLLYKRVRKFSANEFTASVFTFSIMLNLMLLSAAFFAYVVFQDLAEFQQKFSTQPMLFAVLDENGSLVAAMRVVNPLNPASGNANALPESETSRLATTLSVRKSLESIKGDDYKVVAFRKGFFEKAAPGEAGEGPEAVGVLSEIRSLVLSGDYDSALLAAGRLELLMADASAEERDAVDALNDALAQGDEKGSLLILDFLAQSVSINALSSTLSSLSPDELMGVFKSPDAGAALAPVLGFSNHSLSRLSSAEVKALVLTAVVNNALENNPGVLLESFKDGSIEIAPETPTIAFLKAFLPRELLVH